MPFVGSESEVVNKEVGEDIRVEANTMECFLEVDVRFAAVPNGRPAWLASFANENITSLECELSKFSFFKGHELNVGELEVEPAYVSIS